MRSSQAVKPIAPTIAVVPNTRPSDAAALVDAGGAAHEDPRAVEALEDGEAANSTSEQGAEAEQDAPADAVGPVLDLRGDPQRAGRDRAPEQEVQDDHEREERVGEQRVGAPAPAAAALGRRAVPRRRRARPAADEQAAGVGRVGAHCDEGYGVYAPQARASTRRQLSQAIARTSSSVKPAARERVEEPRQPGDVAELVGHRRAVEVGAERDVLDADAVGGVADVGDDRGERRVGVVGAVGAQERRGEDDADEPAGGGDRVELGVGEVARRRRTARARRSARRSAARRPSRATSQKPASLRWLRSTAMPSSAQRRTSRRPAVGQARAGVGRGGEGERDAVGERVRPAPDGPERAQARRRTRARAPRGPGSIASAPSWCMTAASTPSVAGGVEVARSCGRSAGGRRARARAAARPPATWSAAAISGPIGAASSTSIRPSRGRSRCARRPASA